MIDLEKKINDNLNWEVEDNHEIDFRDLTPFEWWIDMPDWLGVFDKGDLAVLAGYPSSWKTAFTYFLAKHNAKIGNKTLYISLELRPRDMWLRLARKKYWVTKKQWQYRNITDQQMEGIKREYNKLKNTKDLKVISYENPPSIEVIERSILKYKKLWYDLFFVDNLGKITWESNENNRFSNITGRLQTLKNNEDICIVLLHHLSKPQQRIMQYSPGWVWAIRGSQKIIDNATLVFELFRNLDPDIESEEEKAMVELILYKDTMDGATWVVKLRFHKWDYLLYKEEIKDGEDESRIDG